MKNRDEIVPLMFPVIELGDSAQVSVDGTISSAGSPGKRTHCKINYVYKISRNRRNCVIGLTKMTQMDQLHLNRIPPPPIVVILLTSSTIFSEKIGL